MRTLKTLGRTEVDALLRRVRRQYAMGRISRYDFEFIETRLEEVDTRIVKMDELNEDDEPEEND